jgi:tetratricopeptide (TPR) repeat protein
MSASRIEKLRGFVEARPDDPFPRYALALEFKNAGDLGQAWQVFEALLAAHPGYSAAYLHAGNTLLGLGRAAQARDVWRQGVQVCLSNGDAHARSELEGALAAFG